MRFNFFNFTTFGTFARSAFATFLFVIAVFGASAPPAWSLAGGRELAANELPHSVVIVAINGQGVCGGGLVGDRLVMTAAHCVVDQRTGRPLAASAISVAPPVVRYKPELPVSNSVPVEKVVVSFATAPERYGNDLALLRLSAPVPGGVPTAVGRPKLRVGRSLRLVAWGPTRENALATPSRFDDPGRARGGRFPIRAASTCTRVKAYRKVFEGSTMVCVGRPDRGNDTCSGDSGSPAMSGSTIVAAVSFSLRSSCSGRRPPGPVILARPDPEFLALVKSEGGRVEGPVGNPTPDTPSPDLDDDEADAPTDDDSTPTDDDGLDSEPAGTCTVTATTGTSTVTNTSRSCGSCTSRGTSANSSAAASSGYSSSTSSSSYGSTSSSSTSSSTSSSASSGSSSVTITCSR